MTFYSDYRTAIRHAMHIHITPLSHAYMEFNEYGYARTVDYSTVVWC